MADLRPVAGKYGDWDQFAQTWEREFIEEYRQLKAAMLVYSAEFRKIRARCVSRSKYGYKPRTPEYEKEMLNERHGRDVSRYEGIQSAPPSGIRCQLPDVPRETAAANTDGDVARSALQS